MLIRKRWNKDTIVFKVATSLSLRKRLLSFKHHIPKFDNNHYHVQFHNEQANQSGRCHLPYDEACIISVRAKEH